MYGVSRALVAKWLRKNGLEVRSVSEGTSIAQKGKPLSPKALAAVRKSIVIASAARTPESFARQAAKVRGNKYRLGQSPSAETRAKIAASWNDPEVRARRIAGMSGANSPHWKGGLRTELEKRLDTAEWRKLRVTIYERDGYACQDCGKACKNTRDAKGDGGAKIQCHHIVPRRDGGTDDPANLVTLCMSCHQKRERAPKDGRKEP